MAAGGAFILDVIMDQREVVQQFDGRSHRGGLDRIAPRCPGNQQGDCRPDALALVGGAGIDGLQGEIGVTQVVADHARQQRRASIQCGQRALDQRLQQCVNVHPEPGLIANGLLVLHASLLVAPVLPEHRKSSAEPGIGYGWQ
jgi:hypothetical protein